MVVLNGAVKHCNVAWQCLTWLSKRQGTTAFVHGFTLLVFSFLAVKRSNSGRFFPRNGLYRHLDPFTTHRPHHIYYVPRHSKALHSAHAMYSNASCYSHIQQLLELTFPRLRHKGIWGTGSSAPLVFNFNARGWWKIHVHCQLNRSLCVSQSRSWRVRRGSSLAPKRNRKIPRFSSPILVKTMTYHSRLPTNRCFNPKPHQMIGVFNGSIFTVQQENNF